MLLNVEFFTISFISAFVLSQTSKVLTTGAVGWFVCGEVIVLVHSQHLGTLLQDVNNKAEDSIIIMCFI
jgi:hypothetical protein